MTWLSRHPAHRGAMVLSTIVAAFVSARAQNLTSPTSVASSSSSAAAAAAAASTSASTTSATNPFSFRTSETNSVINNGSDTSPSNTTRLYYRNTSTETSIYEVSTEPPKDGDSAPEPTVSKEVYERMMTSLDTLTLCFELVSVLLSAISMYIYALADMRCATAYYLVGLNGADTVSGAIVILRNIWKAVDKAEATSTAGFHYLTVYGSLFITISCRRMVYGFFLMLSLERFFVIAFPLKARYMNIIRFPAACILTLVLTTQTYHVYLPLKYKVAPSSRGQGYVMTYSDLFRANEQIFDNVSNAGKILFSYVPLALCMLLNIGLMVVLRRHQASRKSLQETQPDSAKTQKAASAERQLARTIWLSTLLFTLLSLPSNTVQIISSYHDTFRFLGFEHRLYRLVGRFAYLALISTRYTSFLAYLGLSTAFRRNFLRLVRLQKVVRRMSRQKKKSGSSVSGTSMTSLASATQVSVVSSTGY